MASRPLVENWTIRGVDKTGKASKSASRGFKDVGASAKSAFGAIAAFAGAAGLGLLIKNPLKPTTRWRSSPTARARQQRD